MATIRKRSAQENLYIQRIDAVIGYVRENLHEDLSLDTLAHVAGFLPFHFHRIFKSITEETINEMVVRLRLERAAALLSSTPELSLTDAAFGRRRIRKVAEVLNTIPNRCRQISPTQKSFFH